MKKHSNGEKSGPFCQATAAICMKELKKEPCGIASQAKNDQMPVFSPILHIMV